MIFTDACKKYLNLLTRNILTKNKNINWISVKKTFSKEEGEILKSELLE